MFFLNSLYGLLEKITEYALNELYDEQEIKRRIMELAVRYELNEIGEEEYDRQEKKLLAQLRAAREYHERQRAEEEEQETEDEPETGEEMQDEAEDMNGEKNEETEDEDSE
jgi:hypothetical protein